MTLKELLEYIEKEGIKSATIICGETDVFYCNGMFSVMFDPDEGAKMPINGPYSILNERRGEQR